MINKRNTEGYVLAYLLIVITVMGVIAATLMTSTLQVVQAQETSLVYMKDKYEVQGELERFISDLDMFVASASFSKDGYLEEAVAIDSATQDLSLYLNNREKFPLDNYHLISMVKDDENNLVEKFHASCNAVYNEADTLSFSVGFSNSSVAIDASMTTSLEIKTEQYEKVDTPDKPETPDVDEYTSHTEYRYIVLGIDSLVFDSYSITSSGGDTE